MDIVDKHIGDTDMYEVTVILLSLSIRNVILYLWYNGPPIKVTNYRVMTNSIKFIKHICYSRYFAGML